MFTGLKNLGNCLSAACFWLSPTNCLTRATIKSIYSYKPDLATGLNLIRATVTAKPSVFKNENRSRHSCTALQGLPVLVLVLHKLQLCTWVLGGHVELSTKTHKIVPPEKKNPSSACSCPRIWYTLALGKKIWFWIDVVPCLVQLWNEYCTACMENSLKAATAVLNSMSFLYAKCTALP